MNDKRVRVFSRLTLLCLLGIGAISTLTYVDRFNPKAATLSIAVLALLLFIFDTLSEAPTETPEPAPKVSRLVALTALADQTAGRSPELDPDAEAAPSVATLLADNPQLLEIIHASGHQLFLLKLRDYLVRKIKAEYERTGLVQLVAELQKVEAELDSLKISYEPLALPERLTQLMDSFDRQRRVQTYCNVIDALPFLPFRGAIKVYLRLRLR